MVMVVVAVVMVAMVVVVLVKNVDGQRNPELCQRGNSIFHIHVCTGGWSQKERSRKSTRTEVSIHSILTTTMSILSLVVSLSLLLLLLLLPLLLVLLLLHLTYQPFQGVIKWRRVAFFASVCVSFDFSLGSSTSFLFSFLFFFFLVLQFRLIWLEEEKYV